MDALMTNIKPFKSMDEACIALIIKSKYENLELCSTIISKYLNETHSEQNLKLFFGRVAHFKNLFPLKLINNLETTLMDIESCCEEAKTMILKTEKSKCFICDADLQLAIEIQQQAHVYFYSKPSRPCLNKGLKCRNCSTQYWYSYVVGKNGEKRFYEDACNQTFITFSNYTVFELNIFKSFDMDVIYIHSSSKKYCAAYNSLFNHNIQNENREQLIVKGKQNVGFIIII